MTPSKCNLFAAVESKTGNFLTFSQYAEDLTRQYTQPTSYKVVPSKYCAMNISLSNIPSTGDMVSGEDLARIFQNYFENACTLGRATYTGEDGWNPDWSITLFWKTLEKYGLITKSSINGDMYYPEIKNIGEINIWSHNESDGSGVGYNEIYCLIDNSEKNTLYKISEFNSHAGVIFGTNSQYISGYENTNTPVSSVLTVDFCDSYNIGETLEYTYPYRLSTVNIPLVLNSTNGSVDIIKSTNEPFSFNTIVIFYDIINDGDKQIHKNIPLGIYFTGAPTNESKITNSFTKYSTNGDIYGEGTSYALRICSRFVTSHNQNDFGIVDTEAGHDVYYGGISKVLSQFAETTDTLKNISNSNAKLLEEVQNSMSDYRNNRLNVPYIKIINGEPYWFVNGRNTNVSAKNNQNDENDVLKPTNNGWVIYESQSSVNPVVEFDGVNVNFYNDIYIKGNSIINQISYLESKLNDISTLIEITDF